MSYNKKNNRIIDGEIFSIANNIIELADSIGLPNLKIKITDATQLQKMILKESQNGIKEPIETQKINLSELEIADNVAIAIKNKTNNHKIIEAAWIKKIVVI